MSIVRSTPAIIAARLRALRIVAARSPIPGLPATPISLPTATMYLISESGRRITIPYAPREMDSDNFAREWTQIERGVGREPLVVEGKVALPTRNFVLTVGYPDHQRSIAGILEALRAAAYGRERWTISYGSTERGTWRFNAYSESIRLRAAGSNEPTRAECRLGFLAAGPVARIGPVTGGVSAPPPAAPARRTYRVKRGDTLWGIAVKFYGDGRRWPQIADANGVRDPRKLPTFEQSGKELVIP